MELNRCSRCGNFYYSEGNVCPKCNTKDVSEFSVFKSYIMENGLDYSLDTISGRTGISVNNLNRFIEYPEFQNLKNNFENLNNDVKDKNNTFGNDGMFFNG